MPAGRSPRRPCTRRRGGLGPPCRAAAQPNPAPKTTHTRTRPSRAHPPPPPPRARRRLKLPSPPAGSLFLGHAGDLLSETSPVLISEWVRAYGPLIKLRMLSRTMVVLTDPAAAAKLNRLPGATKPSFYRGFDLPSSRGPSMFSDEGTPYWKVGGRA